MQRTVDAIRMDVGQLQQLQMMLSNTVDQVAATQDMTRGELRDLRALFDDFLLRDELARALNLAQVQVVAVQQELDGKFGHFAEVRRLAVGTLQGMDSGIVTQSTMQATAEELMITTPRYWLAPAIVGLAAWIRDDKVLAERALAEALSRDNDKTSLFFALVLRRQRRNLATARWLAQYMVRQNPGELSQEFTVVLDAAATGALGPDAKPAVMDLLGQWYERLNSDRTVVEQQVVRWQALLDGMRTPIDPRYTALPLISPTWPALRELYEGATIHRHGERHFRDVFDRPDRVAPDLQVRVDSILDSLVTSYDTEEFPHRKRKAELEAIIAHEGDKRAAAATAAAEAPVHEGTIDLLTLITNAGFFPDQVGASASTQRLAISLAKDWVVEAAGRLEASNLQSAPTGVQLALEGWTGVVDGSASEEQLIGSLAAHIDAETQAQIAAVRFTAGPFAIGAAVVALILAIVVGVTGGAGGAVFFVLVALGVGGWAAYRYSQLKPRQEHIRQLGLQRREQACEQLRAAIAEMVDLRASWEREIGLAGGFRHYLSGLTRDAFVSGHHDQGREVMP